MTVYADTEEEARRKAWALLDNRCIQSGQEPPVAWTLTRLKLKKKRLIPSK